MKDLGTVAAGVGIAGAVGGGIYGLSKLLSKWQREAEERRKAAFEAHVDNHKLAPTMESSNVTYEDIKKLPEDHDFYRGGDISKAVTTLIGAHKAAGTFSSYAEGERKKSDYDSLENERDELEDEVSRLRDRAYP
jgi:hypothetical protein